MNQRIDLTSLDAGPNLAARNAAQSRVSWPVNLTPESVAYTSDGHLLIIANELEGRLAARELKDQGLASMTLLVTSAATEAGTGEVGKENATDDETRLASLMADTATLSVHQARDWHLAGYLGKFTLTLPHQDGDIDLAKASLGRAHFDLVLDLGTPPTLTLELLPPGYTATTWGTDDSQNAINDLPQQVGEFAKPRYFHIDHDICAHDGRGKTGCTRCLDVCPADALKRQSGRIESWIEIDPMRCHGAGSCTSACPTGAIQYRLPPPVDQQTYVERLLKAYRLAGGQAPVVRFVEAKFLETELLETESLDTQSPGVPGHVLDVPLEELGAAGMDHWLSALTAGAAEVRVQLTATLPPSLKTLIDDQYRQASSLLEALGHDCRRLTILTPGDTASRDALPTLASLPVQDASDLSRDAGKRERLNATLAHLATTGHPSHRRHDMPTGAPFGDVAIDNTACTLCMGCVAVCPTPALAGGRTSPELSFRETDCVQCGLCVATCPEDAIRLVPGFLAAPERDTRQVRKQEAAFPCIRCGKPFASMSAIASIKTKLADHPYFAGDALARLEMCEVCRVKDVWQDLVKDPESQLKI
ncbi:4Fe-4S dicluster domain-containing protein [Halomonas sp. YLGW01]|uniref:4Fe-4S dicluster domain-containing protein n=1 Tax=Halomonas sp. YLGW01 TaxID=2773308 RepID=UPI0017816524|nr:4Fe-4S dicluster domain-containing protein [Halomonas sp. YLGW01]